MKIYFKNPKLDGSLTDFLESLFSNRVSDIFYKSVTTYKNAECSIEECRPARRSFYDIVNIVKTYYDNTYSLEDIAKAINSLPNMYTFKCGDINKWVFMIYNSPYTLHYGTTYHYNIRCNKGVDGFSHNDFVKLVKS